MAEPSPRDKAKGEGAKPTLVAVGNDAEKKSSESVVGRATPAQTAAAAEPKRSRLGLRLLTLGAIAAAVAALVQTQRLQEVTARATALSEQVIGLGAQLSAAHTQIASYEMQRGQLREAVSDISLRVLLLGEMLADDASPTEPAEAP